MHFVYKTLFLPLIAISTLAFSAQCDFLTEQEGPVNINIPFDISPNVIPPGTRLNKYDLLLQVGQDEALPTSPIEVFTVNGFRNILGWDDSKIDAYRESTIQWINERFGLDFSESGGGTFDPLLGTVTTDFGILFPYRYQGYYRVLSSNNFAIPAYTPFTPTSICLAGYIVIFFVPPVYKGTYANFASTGQPIIGDVSDALSIDCFRIFLNYSGSKFYTIFGRCYYPSTFAPEISPPREIARFQLFSKEFGPGFGILNSGLDISPDADGNFQANARGTWSFPGTRLPEYSDWNGFTSAPVEP